MKQFRRDGPGPESASSLDVDAAIGLGLDFGQRPERSSAPWRAPADVLETDDALDVRTEMDGIALEGIEAIIRLPFLSGGELASKEYCEGMLTVVLPWRQVTTIPMGRENDSKHAQRGER